MNRVLHVLEALEGGTARHLVDVVANVHGWEHHVAVPARRVGRPTDLQATPKLRALGAAVHVIDMRRSPLRPQNAAALVPLVRLARAAGVVHGHSSVGGALGRVAAAVARRPAVYTPNGVAGGVLARTVERALGPLTATFVAVSPSERDLAVRERLAGPDRVVVIPNGVLPDVDTSGAPDLRAMLRIPAEAPLVGSIARLTDQKAPGRFAAVAARLLAADERRHVVLIGDGPLRAELAPVLDHPRFHLVAELPGAAAVLDQLDVFLLTSRFEGAPYSPLEAMRVGTPVVLSDVVGNRDAVVPGESGVLVAEDDVAGYVAAVEALLGDPARRHALGAAGRRRVVERFDVRQMGQSLSDLYEKIVNPSARVPIANRFG